MPRPLTEIEILQQFSIPDDTTPTAQELEVCKRILRKLGEPIPDDWSMIHCWVHTATGTRVILIDTEDRKFAIHQLTVRLQQIVESMHTSGNA